MNKISLYILIILVFLGLSKSFSPSERRATFIANEHVFANYFHGDPISLILVDSFQVGFLIKTYFQKYHLLRIERGVLVSDTIILRTTPKFWHKNLPNIGMSLFRRGESEGDKEGMTYTTPMPPGTLYIGNRAYGYWKLHPSGNRIWKFHSTYSNFSQELGWKKWVPTRKFFKVLSKHLSESRPFYGLNNEFGENGTVTKQSYKNTISDNIKLPENITAHLQNLLFNKKASSTR